MPDDVSKDIGDFLEYALGTEVNGLINILTGKEGVEWVSIGVPWPQKKAAIVRHILSENASGKDVYYCPALYKTLPPGAKFKPDREGILGSQMLFLEIDEQKAPGNWEVAAKEHNIPEPTRILQSSVPGNQHVYWRLDEFVTDVDAIEDRNRALSSRLHADMSGWDITQLLRIPHTTNYGYASVGMKPWYKGKSVQTVLLKQDDTYLPVSAFETLQKADKEVLDKIALGDIPTAENALALGATTSDILAHISMSKQEASDSSPNHRSGALQKLAYMLAETGGFSDEQMYAVIEAADTKWDKYAKRSKAGRHKILLDTIAKARAKHGYMSLDTLSFQGLLKDTDSEVTSDLKMVYGFDEFLEADFHVDWILQDFLTTESICFIVGEPGVGKTQAGLNLGADLAMGRDFLTWKNQVGPVKTLFLGLEMGNNETRLFAEKIARNYSDLRSLGRNFKISNYFDDLPLEREESQQVIDNILSEYKPDVLIIDSFQKLSSGGLNDETAMRKVMSIIKRIRVKHKCAIVIIHHIKKMKRTDNGDFDQSDMYGSQFIAANAQRIWGLARDVENKGGLIGQDLKNTLGVMNYDPVHIERTANLSFVLSELHHMIAGEGEEKTGLML